MWIFSGVETVSKRELIEFYNWLGFSPRDAENKVEKFLKSRGKLDVHFSSGKDDWETPDDVFIPLDREFGFTLDVCANKINHKVGYYFDEEDNGLIQDWGTNICWMNPPYSQLKKWLEKAYTSSLNGATVVCLIPARTDTKAWWNFVEGKAEVRRRKGRIKFVGAKSSAPFPSCIVIYRPGESNV